MFITTKLCFTNFNKNSSIHENLFEQKYEKIQSLSDNKAGFDFKYAHFKEPCEEAWGLKKILNIWLNDEQK